MFTITPAHAQQYQLRHYGVSDGLAHGAVHSIYQDRKGYIWFSTREGLSKFDGYTFANFGERDGLGQQFINAVTEDKQGRMWVATNGAGVALFMDDGQVTSGGKFKTFLVNRTKGNGAKPENAVNRILFDSRNGLWALTDGGLYRAPLSYSDLKFEAVKTDSLTESQTPAYADTRGNLWFGYGKEVLEIRDGQFINHGNVSGQIIQSISQDGDGRVVVADFSSLYQLVPNAADQNEEWQKIVLKLKPGQKLYSLWPAAAGHLYIGTSSGLLKWNRDGKQTEINSQVLGSYTIWALAEDRDQNIWISTWANGVYKLSGETIVNYPDNEGHNVRVADIMDDGGVMKATTFPGQVVEFSNGAIKYDTALNYVPTFDHSVTIYRNQKWWASTLGGHYAPFRKPAIRLRNGSDLQLSAIASMEELAHGVTVYEDEDQKLWVWKKTSPGKIYRGTLTSSNKVAFEAFAAQFQEVGYGERMIGDRAGGVWIATAERLCHLRQNQFSCLRTTAGLPEIDPRSLFVDSRGWLWVGQRHRGVSVTKEPSVENPWFVNYSTETGLASDAAWAITEDHQGRIYVGTGKGLGRFDVRTNTWQTFTSRDGLSGDEVSGFYNDRQGNIWIAANGVTRFDPEAENKSLEPPPVYISRVNITGQDLALPETGIVKVAPAELAASRNNVTIDFVGVQFQGEDTLLYQHKLAGADADWSAPTKSRSVNYASLSAGAYTFQVRAINRDGLFSAPATFEFRILRPVYLRWWFVMLTMLLLAGVAFLFYRYRVQHLLALERVRTRIATDLHDDIGSSLSQVSVLSEVIQRRVGSDPVLSEPLSTIAGLSRDLIDSMNDIVWAINPRRDHLSDLTHRMRRFASDVFTARNIEFDFSASNSQRDVKIGADLRREVFLIFKEGVNNIIRHSGCSQASIAFGIEGGWIEMTLTDNGKGFDINRSTDGNGLSSMRQRAGKLAGVIEIGPNNGHGTIVKLRAPLKRIGWFRK